jgi:site-specific DNA-methyltransferase (adenine-specific)
VWEKSKAVGFANAKKMPLKNIEMINVFYLSLPTYNPQGLLKCNRLINNSTKVKIQNNITAINGGAFKTSTYKQNFTNYPRQILKYSVEQGLHPTQKPVALMEYLIKTYTNEGELVLDFTMGSGSTGVACVNTGRNFIGIELDETYFNIAKKRIEEAEKSLKNCIE